MEAFIVLSIILLVGALSAHAQSQQYGPGDTQLIEYSSQFCQSLEAAYDTHDSNIDPSTLYVLSEPPALSGTDSYQFSEIVNVSKSLVVQYDYHFYQGSNISLTVCRDEDNYTFPRFFNLLKGTHQETSIKSLNVTSLCSDGYQSLNYSVTDEGQYCLLAKSYDRQNVSLIVNVSFVRTLYQVPTSNRDRCTIEEFGGSCTVSVPLSKSYALLVYGTSSESPQGWDSDVRIDVACNARIWLYAAIIVPSVLLLLLCVMVISIIVCCVLRRRQRNVKGLYGSETAPLVRSSTSTGRKTIMYDKLTELAITVDSERNPHIVTENPNPPPSFTDPQSNLIFGSPTFSTFKPADKK